MKYRNLKEWQTDKFLRYPPNPELTLADLVHAVNIDCHRGVREIAAGRTNNAEVRRMVLYKLSSFLQKLQFSISDRRFSITHWEVKCDEENNPPDIIQAGNICARVAIEFGLSGKYYIEIKI